MSARSRPIVVSVDRVHRVAMRREETKLARYDILVGSVSRLIARAVSIDPNRTSLFVPLAMLMSRELTVPGVDVPTAIEYVNHVLRRNGFSAVHIGEGVLLVTWPPAPRPMSMLALDASQQVAEEMPARVDEQPMLPAPPAYGALAAQAAPTPSAAELRAAQQTFSRVKNIAARYRMPS